MAGFSFFFFIEICTWIVTRFFLPEFIVCMLFYSTVVCILYSSSCEVYRGGMLFIIFRSNYCSGERQWVKCYCEFILNLYLHGFFLVLLLCIIFLFANLCALEIEKVSSHFGRRR